MNEDFKRIYCPTCRTLLLQAIGGPVTLRIKCRKCTRNQHTEVIVQIAMNLAFTQPLVVQSEIDRPTERD